MSEEKAEQTGVDEAKEKVLAFMSGDEPEPEVEPKPEPEPEPEAKAEPEPEPVSEADPADQEKKPEDDGDLEPVPEKVEVDAPDNKAFARMRHELKQERQRAKELEAKLDGENKPAFDDVINKLVGVWDGSAEGSEEEVLAKIRDGSSDDVVQVYEKALRGDYGEYSSDMLTMAQRELPMIKVREEKLSSEARGQQEKITKAYNDELAQAQKDFPAYNSEKSPESKAMQKWDEINLGEIDLATGEILVEGKFPPEFALYVSTRPHLHRMLADQANRSSTSGAAEKEIASLKKELALLQSPENPAPGVVKAPKGPRTADDVKQELRQLMAV